MKKDDTSQSSDLSCSNSTPPACSAKFEIFKKIGAYVLLYGGFLFIIICYAYNVRTASKPIGWFLLNMATLIVYLVYVLINHILVFRVVSHRVAWIFDSLLLCALLSILCADLWYVSHGH